MSTTVELVRANERYARLRAAVEALADQWERDSLGTDRLCAEELRDLLAEEDS